MVIKVYTFGSCKFNVIWVLDNRVLISVMKNQNNGG